MLPEVLSCHKITGEADYLPKVLVADLDPCSEFVERKGAEAVPGHDEAVHAAARMPPMKR